MRFYLDNIGSLGECLQELEGQESELWWQKHGLMYTASGYGPKIPTRYKVRYNNRLYRVYSACFSNCSSEYIIIKGEKTSVRIDH